MPEYPTAGRGRQPAPEAYRFLPGRATVPIISATRSWPATSIDRGLERAAWRVRAGKLADWALSRIAVRTDCYGTYWRKQAAGGPKVEARTVHEVLTRERLIRHFGGEAPEDRVGVHVVAPLDETCRITVVDIDAHGPEDDPAANWAFAMAVARRAMSRGVEALVLDSNGAGGFHIWIVHAGAVPCSMAYRLGKWLVRDWARHGLRKEPESLPKSPALTGKRYGQFIRLPGRHHKRDHWTRVWDGTTEERDDAFLRGAAAVARILETGGRPDRDLPTPLVSPDFTLSNERLASASHSRRVDPDELDRDAALAREALDYLGEDFFEDYDRWVRVGMALRQLGDQGLALWHEWSAKSRRRYRPEDLDEKWRTFDSAT